MKSLPSRFPIRYAILVSDSLRDDKMKDDFDLSKRITKDVYDKKHQDYQDALQLLEIELSEHRKADHDYQTTVATVMSVARRSKAIFKNSSDNTGKRAFLNYLLQNPTVDGKKLCFTIASPYNLVLELADSPSWLPLVDTFRTCNWVNIKLELEHSAFWNK